LLQALLALEQAALCLQQQPLRTLRPQTVRLSRLQLLHPLLQPIDALLALHSLPRKGVALPFLHGLLELLLTLLTLELSLFRLQQPLLRALRALAFGLLRLQFLHALLQPIDALLALRVLGRKGVALPFLHSLLRLLHLLRRLLGLLWLPRRLGALLALADPILPGWARARGGWTRARRCGDFRSGRARWCGNLWRRTRRHGRTLLRRSRTERRCGGPRHSGRWHRMSHGGRRRRGSDHGCRRSRPVHLLGGRIHARRYHRNAEKKKCCKAKAERKHDRRYLAALYRRPPSFNARPISTRERGNRSATSLRLCDAG
jgi:hypothetical protein